MPIMPWITLAAPSIIQLPAIGYLSSAARDLGGATVSMPSLLAASSVACSSSPMMSRLEQYHSADENTQLHGWLRHHPLQQAAVGDATATPAFQHMLWSCLGVLTSQLHRRRDGVSLATGCTLPADHLAVMGPLEQMSWPLAPTGCRWV